MLAPWEMDEILSKKCETSGKCCLHELRAAAETSLRVDIDMFDQVNSPFANTATDDLSQFKSGLHICCCPATTETALYLPL